MARYGYDYGDPRYWGDTDSHYFRGYSPRRGGLEGYGGSYGRYGGGAYGDYGAQGSRHPEQGGWLSGRSPRDYAGQYGYNAAPDYRGWGADGYETTYEDNGYRGGYVGDAGAVRRRDLRRGPAHQVSAGDLMTENPETVTPDTTLAEAAQRMRDLDVGIMPVVNGPEDDRLRGVITDRDIAVRAAAEGKDMKKAKVSDFMTSDVETCHEDAPVRDVFDVMKRTQVRRVPITDMEGHLVGIIAQADLAVDYAGLDLQREAEVEEVVERISEPARPSWGSERQGWRRSTRPNLAAGTRFYYDWNYGGQGYDRDLGDHLRSGWQWLKQETRGMLGRGYDRGWR